MYTQKKKSNRKDYVPCLRKNVTDKIDTNEHTSINIESKSGGK